MAKQISIKEVSCSFPEERFPYYYADIIIENNTEENYYVNKLWVDGEGCRDFVIYQDRNYVYDPLIAAGRKTSVKARANWKNGDVVKIEVELVASGAKKQVLQYAGKAPEYGGYWNSSWKYYFSLLCKEKDGLHRINYPVHTTVSLYKDRVTNIEKELRIVEVDPKTGEQTMIPLQISDVRECITEEDDTRQCSISFDLAFYANLEPNSTKVYLGFYGNAEADAENYESPAKVSGSGLGRTIENGYYKIQLHPKSGMIDEVTVKRGKDRTFLHKIETNGAVHWNPGVYTPPRPWTHASDWDPPAGSCIEVGPIYTMVKLWGELPLYPETMCSVTYLYYTRLPFVRMSSSLRILEDLNVQALRNGEIVVNHDLAKKFAWRNRHGEIKTVVVTDLPRFEEIPLTMEAETPWTAYYNEDNNVGLGSMTLNVAHMCEKKTQVKLEKYEQMMNWGPWTYVSRPIIFPFGSQNPQRMVQVPESSIYYEDMVFMPFLVKDEEDDAEKFNEMEYWYQRLSSPVRFIAEMDTDKRVPAEFVLGERMEGAIEETVGKSIPIELDRNFTRFRQSQVLLNEDWLETMKKRG